MGSVVVSITDSSDSTSKSEHKPGRLYRDEGGDLWVAIQDSLGNVGVIPLLGDDGVWVGGVDDIFKGGRYNEVSSTPVEFYIKTA